MKCKIIQLKKIPTVKETMDKELERIRLAVKKIDDIANRTVYKDRSK